MAERIAGKMNLHIPVELFDALLIFLLTILWKSYRAVWRHIIRLEKLMLMIMVMLRDRGFEVPDQGDTEVFKRANNL